MSETVDAVKKVYFHSMPSVKMHNKEGTEIVFVNHRFITDDPALQLYLDSELDRRNTSLSTVPYQEGMDDPIRALKNKMRAEILEEERIRIMTQSHNPDRNMGESVQGPLSVQSTRDIAPVAANGGPSGAALLASLGKK